MGCDITNTLSHFKQFLERKNLSFLMKKTMIKEGEGRDKKTW